MVESEWTMTKYATTIHYFAGEYHTECSRCDWESEWTYDAEEARDWALAHEIKHEK